MALFWVPVTKYNELLEKLEDLQKAYQTLQKDYNRVNAENVSLREENNRLRQENAALAKQVDELTAATLQLMDKVNDLAEKNAKLTEHLNMNSQNSSKPPSTDDLYQKPTPKSLRKSTGKKAGGQFGHEGHGISFSFIPDEIIKHTPGQCETCPYTETCARKETIVGTSYVIDTLVTIKTDQHLATQRDCPLTGEVLRASMPEGITGSVQYGEGICAMVATLYSRGIVSIGRIAEFMGAAFGTPISEGTVANIIDKCMERVYPAVEIIYTAVIDSPVTHFDETGLRVEETLNWAHVASTSKYTYLYIEEKRGQAGMNDGGVLPLFRHTGVHDCFSPYFQYGSMRHALCNDHVQRDLQSVTDNQKQLWAGEMSRLFYEMESIKQSGLAKGLIRPPQEQLDAVCGKYDEILAKARLENTSPVPKFDKRGKPVKDPVKDKKTAALINRLAKHKGHYCLFFEDYSVPRSNNQAERDFRMLKVKQKVSGCFRTVSGADYFLCIMSYISTAKKHGVDAYNALLLAFQGRACEVVCPKS